jgi:excinuclease UvrABC ATPase subunit
VTGLDHIEVRGARENNLRDVSVDIPKRAINETYTTFLQSFMPNVGRPDVDTLSRWSTAACR